MPLVELCCPAQCITCMIIVIVYVNLSSKINLIEFDLNLCHENVTHGSVVVTHGVTG